MNSVKASSSTRPNTAPSTTRASKAALPKLYGVTSRITKLQREEQLQHEKLQALDPLELYITICRKVNAKPVTELFPFLATQQFVLDFSRIDKDRTLFAILEFLSQYRHFSQIRLRCSESRDSLWSNSLERSSQHKVDPQSSTSSHANSTRPNKSGAATKDLAKLKIQAPQKINTLIMRALSTCISNSTSLDLLELDGLEFSSYAPLLQCIPSCTLLTKLYIRNCNLGDSGLHGLVTALHGTALQHFQAAACHLTSDGGEAVRRLLQRDRMRDEENVWMHGLRDEPLVESPVTGLVWCDVSFNRLGNIGLAALIRILGDDSPLLVLDVRQNGIVLSKTSVTSRSSLHSIKSSDAPNASSTRVSRKTWQPQQNEGMVDDATEASELAVILCAALRNNTTIQHVDFRHNAVDPAVQAEFDVSLQRNRANNSRALLGLKAPAPPVLVQFDLLHGAKLANSDIDHPVNISAPVAQVTKPVPVNTSPLPQHVSRVIRSFEAQRRAQTAAKKSALNTDATRARLMAISIVNKSIGSVRPSTAHSIQIPSVSESAAKATLAPEANSISSTDGTVNATRATEILNTVMNELRVNIASRREAELKQHLLEQQNQNLQNELASVKKQSAASRPVSAIKRRSMMTPVQTAPRPFLTGCTPSRVSRPASANAFSNHNTPRHIIQSNDLDKGVNGNSGRLATKGGAAAASQMRALSSALSTTLTRLRRLTTAVQHGHPLPADAISSVVRDSLRAVSTPLSIKRPASSNNNSGSARRSHGKRALRQSRHLVETSDGVEQEGEPLIFPSDRERDQQLAELRAEFEYALSPSRLSTADGILPVAVSVGKTTTSSGGGDVISETQRWTSAVAAAASAAKLRRPATANPMRLQHNLYGDELSAGLTANSDGLFESHLDHLTARLRSIGGQQGSDYVHDEDHDQQFDDDEQGSEMAFESSTNTSEVCDSEMELSTRGQAVQLR